MNNSDDINEYLPSILNPRAVRKQQGHFTLTQNSIVSRCSLTLKRKNGAANAKKVLYQSFPLVGKENSHIKKRLWCDSQNVRNCTSVADSPLNFSHSQEQNQVNLKDKENSQNILNSPNPKTKEKTIDEISIGFSDLITDKRDNNSSPFSFGDVDPPLLQFEVNNNANYENLISLSSDTELDDNALDSTTSTVVYELTEKPIINVSFEVKNCESLNISTNNSRLKHILVTNKDNAMNVDCEVEESSVVAVVNDDEVIELSSEDESPPKKRVTTVNLEIKKKTSTENSKDTSKVLILNTDAIERLSHVIVQPPNYNLVKRKFSDTYKFQNKSSVNDNGKLRGLKQRRIDSYLKTVVCGDVSGDGVGMSGRASGVEGGRCERKVSRREGSSPRPRQLASNASSLRAPTVASDQRCTGLSPKKQTDSIQFNLPPKSSAKNSAHKSIPFHKFVAGTHFAVDAFSYGEIPMVNHYFLTHFHSDHYSGLKKSFNKALFCSKITAELCTTRLGVNPKYIKIINFDETITIDGIEVLAVDANHCPGSLMLIFSLPNGKTLLHTGDFRASPQMESYPVFWNKDIHTVYLDSTYCNPRYDFPTQEQCLEMALYLLRQKKLALEKIGKKFSSVLIVCGTYTIGKEKFFLGMARRVGCSVWACPEKDKVLQVVEGRSFGTQTPAACQLHVVPMRDLTHEKLRAYLDSLQGAYCEVVAFKPSGWENGKNSTVERDLVTIHGIPYSEHSSFSEMIRFVKFLQPKQVVPTVDISGGTKAVQKYFPCPLVSKESAQNQSKLTDFFSIQHQQHVPAVT